MQNESAATTQITGMFVGIAFVMVTFFVLTWCNRKVRLARQEKPPQKEKLLRPAGYWLQLRLEQLSEKWNEAIIYATLGGSLVGLFGGSIYPVFEGLLLRRFTFSQIRALPNSYLLLSIGALAISAGAWTIAHITKAFQIQREIRNCRFGFRGELAVAEALADRSIATAGYLVFHDVPGDGKWNLDHVVVGPGGIFVLETKTRSRRKSLTNQPDHIVRWDGKVLYFPWFADQKATRQVEQNAKWLKNFVADVAPPKIVVHPVIVVPGWYVEAGPGVAANQVFAMNAEYLVKFLANSKPLYHPKDLKAVIRLLDDRCRDVEF